MDVYGAMEHPRDALSDHAWSQLDRWARRIPFPPRLAPFAHSGSHTEVPHLKTKTSIPKAREHVTQWHIRARLGWKSRLDNPERLSHFGIRVEHWHAFQNHSTLVDLS